MKKIGLKTKHVSIPIKGRKNQWDQIQIQPAKPPGSASAPGGFYYLALWVPEEPHPGVAAAARPRDAAQLHQPRRHREAFGAVGSGLGHALSTGQPQPGAEVSIRDAKRRSGGTGPTTPTVWPCRRPGRRAVAAARTSAPSATAPPPGDAGRRRRPTGEDGDGFEGDGRLRRAARGRHPGVRPAGQGHDLGQPDAHGRPRGVELQRAD